MRLLDVHDFPPAVPEDAFTRRPYGILSHVWEEDELLFAHLREPEQIQRTHSKILGAQRQAQRDGLDHVWIDTLCIDKSSSSELGEAINSMYRWYQEAAVCYVYLADLDGCPRLTDADILKSGSTADKRYWGASFRESKWFTRGWCLQELIAPYKLCFYDKSWNFIGTLQELAATVSEITNIHLSMLRHQDKPHDFSIAQRLSWAANRETTRPEDRAYSLLGLLDMSISIRYGEGSEAFLRLQEAIIARDADQSIFAWERRFVRQEDVYFKERRESLLYVDPEWTHLLAPSPDSFASSRDIVPSSNGALPYRMTNLGLYITSDVPDHSEDSIILNCHYQNDPTRAILLNIKHQETLRIRSEEAQGHLPPETIAHVFLRERSPHNLVMSRLSLMDVDQAYVNATPQTFYISRSLTSRNEEEQPCKVWLQLLNECEGSLRDMPPPPVSKLDFVEPAPSLHFRAADPQPDDHTTNITWTLVDDVTTSLPEQSIIAKLQYATEGSVAIHMKLSNKRAFLGLTSPNPERPGEQFESVVAGGKRDAKKALETQLFVEPGLAVRAALQREQYHGQDMYVIKVCTVRTKIPRWRLKRSWMWRRRNGYGGNAGCGPG